MERMEEEADALGADGIVARAPHASTSTRGARTSSSSSRSAPPCKHEQGQRWRAPNGKPFTSDLSGQDFWTLLHAGYRPLGFVMGNCVYHVAHRACPVAGQPSRTWSSPNYTQALYDARELAMERMQAEAEALGAEGIVGVTVDETNHTWGPQRPRVLAPSAPRSSPISRGPPDPDADARPHGERLSAERRHAARPQNIDLDARACARVAQGGIPIRAAAAPRRRGRAAPQALHERSLGQRVPARARRRSASPSRR